MKSLQLLGREAIFIDEAIFNQKMIQKRAWSNKRENIKPVNMLYLEPSQSVLLAVS